MYREYVAFFHSNENLPVKIHWLKINDKDKGLLKGLATDFLQMDKCIIEVWRDQQALELFCRPVTFFTILQ